MLTKQLLHVNVYFSCRKPVYYLNFISQLALQYFMEGDLVHSLTTEETVIHPCACNLTFINKLLYYNRSY